MTNNLLVLAEKSAKSKDYEKAIDYCNEYLSFFPSDTKGLRLLAFIYSLKRDYNHSIKVISSVIEFCKNKTEPSDYFNRGRWLLEIQNYEAANSDFLRIIELCNYYGDNYYLESAYLFHAVALIEKKSYCEALDVLQHVSNDCTGFVMGRVLSKAELLGMLSS